MLEPGVPGVTGGFGKVCFFPFLNDHTIFGRKGVFGGQGALIGHLNSIVCTDSGFGLSLYFIDMFILPRHQIKDNRNTT